MKLTVLAAAVAFCTAAGAADTTVIGGHTYAFPPAAFMGGTVETGRVGSVLLELAWPEMRPLTPAETVAWPKRYTIRILANSGAPVAGDAVPDSELLADMPLRVAVATNLSVKQVEGSHGHIPLPRLDPTPVAPGNAIPGNGMERVLTEALQPDSSKPDVFVPEPLTQPQRFILCDRLEGSTVNPGCAQEFVAADLALKVSYRRPLVPQWREIEAGTIAFFQAHEVRP